MFCIGPRIIIAYLYINKYKYGVDEQVSTSLNPRGFVFCDVCGEMHN